MTDTATRIAAGLERAFAAHGFAEPNIETLRAAAGVSLRTLYKYTPSRGGMVLAALEHRHGRYLAQVFADLPPPGPAALSAVFARIGGWMAHEAARGCLFHAAVAAAPQDARLHALLERHKAEVTARAGQAAGLEGREAELCLLIEGLTQSWPLNGESAVESANRLAQGLFAAAPGTAAAQA